MLRPALALALLATTVPLAAAELAPDPVDATSVAATGAPGEPPAQASPAVEPPPVSAPAPEAVAPAAEAAPLPPILPPRADAPAEAERPAPARTARSRRPIALDVAEYPADQQARFALVEQKCVRCHTLTTALSIRLDDERWERHRRRMAVRAGSALSDDQARAILEFLEFHATRRGGQY